MEIFNNWGGIISGFHEKGVIDFNGMSTSLKLSYAYSLGNCTFNIYIFSVVASKEIFFCTQLYHIKYSYQIEIISTKLNGFK